MLLLLHFAAFRGVTDGWAYVSGGSTVFAIDVGFWNDGRWYRAVFADAGGVTATAPAIDPASVIDLTDRLRPDGTLDLDGARRQRLAYPAHGLFAHGQDQPSRHARSDRP